MIGSYGDWFWDVKRRLQCEYKNKSPKQWSKLKLSFFHKHLIRSNYCTETQANLISVFNGNYFISKKKPKQNSLQNTLIKLNWCASIRKLTSGKRAIVGFYTNAPTQNENGTHCLHHDAKWNRGAKECVEYAEIIHWKMW